MPSPFSSMKAMRLRWRNSDFVWVLTAALVWALIWAFLLVLGLGLGLVLGCREGEAEDQDPDRESCYLFHLMTSLSHFAPCICGWRAN